jgi:hypothetical protein
VVPLILLLVLAAVVFGFGFVATWLFILAAALFVVWTIGLFAGRGRFYNW